MKALVSAADPGPATPATGFHTTHWTVVIAARDATDTAARQALASLCSTYWYPLYAFIRRQGTSPAEAEVKEEIRHLISLFGA
jgi:hypothetical protein